MFTRKIKYTDYLGNQREEEFLFNISPAEEIKMELGEKGGLTARINKIIEAQDIPELVKMFDFFIDASIGYVSPDGREFVKSEEYTKSFHQSAAYDEFYIQLLTEKGLAAEFINSIIPDNTDLTARIEKAAADLKVLPAGK